MGAAGCAMDVAQSRSEQHEAIVGPAAPPAEIVQVQEDALRPARRPVVARRERHTPGHDEPVVEESEGQQEEARLAQCRLQALTARPGYPC